MMLAVSAAIVVMAALLIQKMRFPTSIEIFPAKPHETATMRAVVYDEHGDASVLRIEENHPRPVPKDTQVLVKVHAASINPCDFKFRRNKVPNFLFPKPKIPGEDIAGVIVQVGSKVTGWKEGDRVAAMLPSVMTKWGGLAEYVAVDATLVARVEKADLTEAASLPLVSTTVLQAIESVPEKERKGKILIHAGAGGVGSFAIQYAKYLGLFVATTASAEKQTFVKELGADIAIDYRTTNFEDVIEDYDIVFDSMSWAYEERTLKPESKVLRPGGYYLNIASSDWAWDGKERANGVSTLVNRIKLTLSDFGIGKSPKYRFIAVTLNGEQLLHMMNLLEDSKIRATIDHHFPISCGTPVLVLV
jgi:alcohol dehydrogenase